MKLVLHALAASVFVAAAFFAFGLVSALAVASVLLMLLAANAGELKLFSGKKADAPKKKAPKKAEKKAPAAKKD